MHRALFVGGQNRLRSPTAEEVFSKIAGVECASAGTDERANVPLDPELVEWADTIYVMEASHRNRITRKFKKYLAGKRIVVLNIPDEYEFMQPALVAILERRVGPLLARYALKLQVSRRRGANALHPSPAARVDAGRRSNPI